MANIALDIKANTQKALGEFKKLSRELDNKFLVQGLKLDVVKNAFTQINREFENAVGQQGLRAAESSGQLQRNLALNLATFRDFGRKTADVVSKDVLNSLQELRAEGTITGKVLQDSLNIAGFLDFDATGPELQRKLRESTNTIAKFVQQTSDLFGSEQGQRIQQALTGQISVDDLFQVATGQGSGATNAFKKVFQEYQDRLRNADPTIRTQAILEVIKKLESDPAYEKSFRQIKPIESVFREINGLFSEKGLFGALRAVGDQIENFNGDKVDRNLLQVTGKLLRTLFDREDGVFAKLNKALQKAFGDFDVLEPILSGVTFLTEVFEKLGNFFESSEFQSFLNIFDGLVDGLKSIFSGGGLNFSAESINKLVDGIFEAIRGLFNNISKFILGLDAGAISSVIGNIIGELVKTLPSLLKVIFIGLGKGIETIFSDGRIFTGALAAGGIASLLGIDKFLGGQGPFTSIQNRLNKALGRRGGRGLGGLFQPGRDSKGQFDKVTGERLTGFQSAVLRYMREIIRVLDPDGSFLDQGPDSNRRRRRRVRRTTPGRDGRTPRQRALDMRRLRRGGGLGSRLSRGLGSRLSRFNLLRNIPTGVPGISSFSNPQGDNLGRLLTDYRSNRSMFDINNRVRGGSPSSLPGATPEGIRFRAPEIPRPIPSTAAGGGLLSRLGGATKGLRGGLRRIPLLGTLLSGLAIASIVGAPGADASEMEGLTPEEKKEQRRREEREKTRGVLGVIGGIAGGAAGGAALGTVIGGPVGTLIGGIIGGIVGEEAVKMLSDPIIDGIGSLAKQLGGALGGLWESGVEMAKGGWRNITNFFGPDGPIQSIGKFLYEIPGNIVNTIKEKFEEAKQGFAALPGNLLEGIKNFFTGNNTGGGNANTTPKRSLGGVGKGMTLVGENGPELVNLGSGANVIPNSSLMGGLYGNFRGGGRGAQSSVITNNITINIEAPGADEFSDQLTDAVIAELNRQYNLQEAQ